MRNRITSRIVYGGSMALLFVVFGVKSANAQNNQCAANCASQRDACSHNSNPRPSSTYCEDNFQSCMQSCR
jgi:hypothetical protein